MGYCTVESHSTFFFHMFSLEVFRFQFFFRFLFLSFLFFLIECTLYTFILFVQIGCDLQIYLKIWRFLFQFSSLEKWFSVPNKTTNKCSNQQTIGYSYEAYRNNTHFRQFFFHPTVLFPFCIFQYILVSSFSALWNRHSNIYFNGARCTPFLLSGWAQWRTWPSTLLNFFSHTIWTVFRPANRSILMDLLQLLIMRCAWI